jgi:hypothetical protein
MSDFDDAEPSLKLEEIERRREPRGIMSDLTVTLASGDELPALEASRKGVFVATDDPESFRLGDVQEIGVRRDHDGVNFRCRVEVARKEIHPRKGVALRIIHMTPVAEETLKRIVGDA